MHLSPGWINFESVRAGQLLGKVNEQEKFLHPKMVCYSFPNIPRGMMREKQGILFQRDLQLSVANGGHPLELWPELR